MYVILTMEVVVDMNHSDIAPSSKVVDMNHSNIRS